MVLVNPFKLILDASGLTQREVARRLEMPSAVFNRYCTGKRKPSATVALRIITELAGKERDIWIPAVREYLLGDKVMAVSTGLTPQVATEVVTSVVAEPVEPKPDRYGFFEDTSQ